VKTRPYSSNTDWEESSFAGHVESDQNNCSITLYKPEKYSFPLYIFWKLSKLSICARLARIHILECDHKSISQTFFKKNEIGGIITAKENCRLVFEDTTPMTAKTRIELDLKDRVLRKTWKLLGFSRSRTYRIDDRAGVQIQDNSILIEGYKITSFSMYITGRSGTIRISSADDLKEARLVPDEITEFLKEATAEGSDMGSS
jgi:hypothetical protein